MTLQGENKLLRVLVVDDSTLMSRQIINILVNAGGIEVVGRAKDGIEAIAMVKELKPDVVTMDVEMPRMNGLTALKHIMLKHPVPTVMISALTTEGARTTFNAFKFGAIDVVAKPSRKDGADLTQQKAEIVSKVKRAAAVAIDRMKYIRVTDEVEKEKKNGNNPTDETSRIVVIGSGVGGNHTLLKILPLLPADFKPVMVAMLLVEPRYIPFFVSFLDSHSVIPVKTVETETVLHKGVCYICSGYNAYSLTKAQEGNLVLNELASNASAGNDTGAIDAFFTSVANLAGSRTVGIIMSGQGSDGAQGLMEIRKHGGVSIAQASDNCSDPSMPQAALKTGFVEHVLPDYRMAEFLRRLT